MSDGASEQHNLLERVLKEAGGLSIETVVPSDYFGKIADILFPADNVVFEIKTLTTDRGNDPNVIATVSEMFARSAHLGAPAISGPTSVSLHDLDPRIAANTLRIIGQRVQTEARAASKQLKATKRILGRPDAIGVIALVTPPFKLDRQSIAWLLGDAMRNGQCSGIDIVLLVETPLAIEPCASLYKNSFLSLHSRDGQVLPSKLFQAVDDAWGRVTGQVGKRVDSEEFRKFGATS